MKTNREISGLISSISRHSFFRELRDTDSMNITIGAPVEEHKTKEFYSGITPGR